MVAAAACGGNVLVTNTITDHLKPVIAKLRGSGVEVVEGNVRCQGDKQSSSKSYRYQDSSLSRFSYGYASPNDGYAYYLPGNELDYRDCFENRFMHVNELKKNGCRYYH